MPEIDADATIAALALLEKRLGAAAYVAVGSGIHLVERRGKDTAPVGASGQFRDSISADGPMRVGSTIAGEVGPTLTTYGRRIELGYHGTDRLGRKYSIGGHRTFGAAVSSSRPAIRQLFITKIMEALSL